MYWYILSIVVCCCIVYDISLQALLEAGAIVPDSFDTLGTVIRSVNMTLHFLIHFIIERCMSNWQQLDSLYLHLRNSHQHYQWTTHGLKYNNLLLFVLFYFSSPQELGLIRKPSSFLSSICDERGEELLYAGMPISDVFKEEIGIGGVLSLLWFQRRYSCITPNAPSLSAVGCLTMLASFQRCV